MPGDPRPFQPEDLRSLKKTQLYNLVLSKPLPPPTRVNAKTNKKKLIDILLDSSLGYRTLDPPPQQPEDKGMRDGPQRDGSAARLSAELEVLDREEPPPNSEHSVAVANERNESAVRLPAELEDLDREALPLNVKAPIVVANAEIVVYVTDYRFKPGDFHAKTCQQVTVPATPCSDGDYQVKFRDVLSELQSSPAAIVAGNDPVAIGMPDHIKDSSYTRCLAVGVVGSLLDVLGESEVIDIPGDLPLSTIELRVEEANPNAKRTRKLEDEDIGPSSGPMSKRVKVVDANESGDLDEAGPVNVLRSKLAERPGYSKFRASCHKVLQNPDIPDHWEFAAKFSADFHGRRLRSNLLITKAMVHAALGSGETWLVEAEKGYQLVKKYGKGGEHEAEEVVREISTKRPSPAGSKRLLKFLKDWDVAHGERLL